MRKQKRLIRKSVWVDERALRRAKKLLGVTTDAEVIRLSVDRIAEMETFWRFMRRSRGSLQPGSVQIP
jgi:hypothetical protein